MPVPKISFSQPLFLKLKEYSPALAIGCMGAWVAARCILDASEQMDISFIACVAFLAIIFWQVLFVQSKENSRFCELIVLPSTLIWATWMAYRGIEFFPWWLPAIVLITVFTSSQLVLSILSISIMLISTMLLLQFSVSDVWEVIASTIVVASIALLHRKTKEAADNSISLKIENMALVCQAAHLLHAKLNSENELISGSSSLFNQTGLSPSSGKSHHLQDLIHPSDHAIALRASRNALDSDAGMVSTAAACDCRLLRQGGNTLWTHAQFVREKGECPRIIVTFISIDEQLRAIDALRESQRRLASQTLELSAQFDASKMALQARQEVERLAQHDIRSPLKSIEATAALLRKSRALSSNEERLLTSIEHTAARALSMVTMSLDLYRMEEGTFKFVPESTDLITIGRSVVAEFVQHARSKNVRLEFDTALVELKAIGNTLLTTSIVENLVRNAIEAAPEYSAVTIGLYQGARVGIIVHNVGEVDRSIRKNFFEKYTTYGKRGGLGLGTYSARLIARAQGGDLTMTSSSENGTLLLLKLRRSIVDSTASVAVDRQGAESFGPSLPGNLIELPKNSDAASSPSPLDVLVVEDDDHNWLLLLSWLPKYVGARRAINGREAVDALTARRPDLIIMDLEMPIMGGFEALHRIREMQSAAGERSSVVYAFTGHDDPETTAKIRESGFDGILIKPVKQYEFEDLLKTISGTGASLGSEQEMWIEKTFIDAFPTFVDSRRALINDIERAAHEGDVSGMRRAAHTLSGSPAIHGFKEGISLCRKIIGMSDIQDLTELEKLVFELRRIFNKPSIR